MKSNAFLNIHNIRILDSVTLTVCNCSQFEDLLIKPNDDLVSGSPNFSQHFFVGISVWRLELGEHFAINMPFTVTLLLESYSMNLEPF